MEAWAAVALAIVMFLNLIVMFFNLIQTKGSRKVAEHLSKPDVLVALRPHEMHLTFLMFCIENVGGGTAWDIQFSTNFEGNIPSERLEFIRQRKIAHLGSGQKIEHFLVSVIGCLEQLKQTPLEITVTYKESTNANTKITKDFCLDFGEFEGLSRAGKAPLLEISEATKGIKKDLYKILTKSLDLHENAMSLISEGSILVRPGDKVKTRRKLIGKTRDTDTFVAIPKDQVCTVLEATMSSLIVESDTEWDAGSQVVYHGNPHHFLVQFELLE